MKNCSSVKHGFMLRVALKKIFMILLKKKGFLMFIYVPSLSKKIKFLQVLTIFIH